MKIRLGSIPTDNEFYPEKDGWNKCKEPKAWIVTWFISVPISILLGLIFVFLVQLLTDITWDGISINGFLMAFLILIIIHEIIHAIMHPDRGSSNKTVLGFWPSHLVFYAHYEGERTRKNFLLGLIAPFVILSVVPLLMANFLKVEGWWYGVVIILNAFFSSVDIFSVACVFFGVPRDGIVINKGWYTYWRSEQNITNR